MAKNRAFPMPDEGHDATGAEYQKECQRLIDQSNYSGNGQPPFPDRIVVHEYPCDDEVKHIWQPKQEAPKR